MSLTYEPASEPLHSQVIHGSGSLMADEIDNDEEDDTRELLVLIGADENLVRWTLIAIPGTG